MLSVRELLIDGFEYDAWANRQWLPLVTMKPKIAEVFTHIVWAQETWYARISGDTVLVTDDPLRRLNCINELWIGRLQTCDLDEIVAYRNTKGESFNHSIGNIARHVVDNGTYHRGQLLALAEVAKVSWPETGMNFFHIDSDSKK